MEDAEVNYKIYELLDTCYTSSIGKEVVKIIGTKSYVDASRINGADYMLNLRNGMFDINALTLLPHDPKYYSTIQLDVNYLQDAECPVWTKTLEGIFPDSPKRISDLQEYFGYCLTREVKYEKALLLLGEGANGKSTIIRVLQSILGEDNYTSITLDDLKSKHYQARLYGKLVNFGAESLSKGTISDSILKLLVSGDTIEADEKYKGPFTFRPFCKLIFALNRLPRILDKSDGFFRKILIMRFEKQFSDEEQNKDLSNILLSEKDGIFMWAIEGLKRLRARGRFDIDSETKEEISDYRQQNNSILNFAENECFFHPQSMITMHDLHTAYKDWCGAEGFMAFGKNKFGRELTTLYPTISKGKDSSGNRIWVGLDLQSSQGMPVLEDVIIDNDHSDQLLEESILGNN